jgi:hypothetical protein
MVFDSNAMLPQCFSPYSISSFLGAPRGGTTMMPVPASVFDNCCLSVEESLNSVYRQCRAADRSVGPLEIPQVGERQVTRADRCDGAWRRIYPVPNRRS